MLLLGIETSCDETSAAVLDETTVLSNIISSQAVHLKFGGVVPELASRAHMRKIVPVVEEALEQANTDLKEIEAVAVTHGPGLVGALLVGVNYAKALAMYLNIPMIGVNHLEGHIYSAFLNNSSPSLPMLFLIVSGGHSLLVVMREHLQFEIVGTTRDDAVGEAFDKVAKILGLPYPGGPQIDNRAREGDSSITRFPIALNKEKTLDFSYSGLKTAVLTFRNKQTESFLQSHMDDICASFQQAAVSQLIERTIAAARMYQIKEIGVVGGVSANSQLRTDLARAADEYNLSVTFPEMSYCMDNAAMIARAGLQRLGSGFKSGPDLNAYPSLRLGEVLTLND